MTKETVMPTINEGYNPEKIAQYKTKIDKLGKNYIVVSSEDNSEEYINFNFIGFYQGKEVIYDAVMYTLRLHHLSEVYEVAEHKAAQHFPQFKKIRYSEDENGDLAVLDDVEEEIGLFIAEAIMEIEEEEEVKVREHVEVDANIDFGVGLDIGLNVDVITEEVIQKFVAEFNNDTLKLDDVLYTFETQDEEMTE